MLVKKYILRPLYPRPLPAKYGELKLKGELGFNVLEFGTQATQQTSRAVEKLNWKRDSMQQIETLQRQIEYLKNNKDTYKPQLKPVTIYYTSTKNG